MKYILAIMLFSTVFATSIMRDNNRIHIDEPGPVIYNITNDYNAIVPPAPPVPPPGPIYEDEIIYDNDITETTETSGTTETDDDSVIELVIII